MVGAEQQRKNNMREFGRRIGISMEFLETELNKLSRRLDKLEKLTNLIPGLLVGRNIEITESINNGAGFIVTKWHVLAVGNQKDTIIIRKDDLFNHVTSEINIDNIMRVI